MTSAAYELESSSRRIWGLRYEHSWEFEGYSEAGHQAVFSKWQAEYEMWADTVLDIQDGQILADAANPSKYAVISITRDTEDWESQSRLDRPGFQELNREIQHPSPSMRQGEMLPHLPQQMTPHQQILQQQQTSIPQQMPPQQQFSLPQQMAQLQNLSMDQSTPPSQSMQNSQSPQPMSPGLVPQNGPTPTFSDQNMPPQQRQQSPQPSQMRIGQNPPPNMQHGQSVQPGQFNASPNMQNAPIGPAPNMQQPPNMPDPDMQQPQNTRPSQPPNMQQAQNRPPPQQYVRQNQGMPSDSAPKGQRRQELFGAAGPQGPPRNGISPGQSTPQGLKMGPRQNPSSRPGSQVPSSLQAGGQTLGGGRS